MQQLRHNLSDDDAVADDRSSTLTTPYDAEIQRAISLYDNQQIHTLGSIAVGSKRLWPAFLEAGGIPALFNRRDTRIIAACVASLEADQARRIAGRWLKEEGLWDDAAPACWYGRMIWSDVTLDMLFDGWFLSPCRVAADTRELLWLAQQLKDLKDAERYIVSVIGKIDERFNVQVEVAA